MYPFPAVLRHSDDGHAIRCQHDHTRRIHAHGDDHRLPGGARVDAHFGDFVVPTDQPRSGGGDSSAPTPFATFLSTIGTCAGIYVLGFCRQRGIAADGIRLVQRMQVDPMTHLVRDVRVTIELPPSFPDKYAGAVVRAAEQCAVKKHFEHPPVIRVDRVPACR